MDNKRVPTPPHISQEARPFLSPSSAQEYCCATTHKDGHLSGDCEGEVSYDFSTSPNPSHTNGSHVPQRKIESFETEPIKEEKQKGCKNYFGIMLALFAGFIFTVGTILAKHMKHYHPFTLTLYRVQGVWIPALFMILYSVYIKKTPVFEPILPLSDKGKRKTLIGILLRAAIGCSCLFLHFGALKYLQVADVSVVGSCKPIFVTIAAFIFLGESCGFLPVFLALLTIVGVGVITRPPILTGEEDFDRETLIGAGLALSSIILDTCVVIIIRSLKRIHVSLMMFVLGVWSTLQSGILAFSIGELKLPESGRDWLFALGMAAVAILNQAAMHVALQFEQANPVAITRTMDFIFAFSLQFIIMGIVPDLYSVSGAAIIIMCVILTVFRKWLMTLPKQNVYRKRFRFMMI